MNKKDEFIASMAEGHAVLEALERFNKWCHAISSSGLHGLNPYHNMRHSGCVVKYAQRIYTYETGNACEPELLLMGWMHDYNHSGGHHSDAVNIERARAGVHKFENHPRMRHVDVGRVIKGIECTYFDGKGFPIDPVTDEEKALRDADLMAIYEKDAVVQLLGLLMEIHVQRPTLSVAEFFEGNATFLRNAKMYTQYGNAVKEQYLEERLAHVAAEAVKLFTKEKEQA